MHKYTLCEIVFLHKVQKPDTSKLSVGPKKKFSRCGKCKGCKMSDCGRCIYCKDKPKFGGNVKKKQAYYSKYGVSWQTAKTECWIFL